MNAVDTDNDLDPRGNAGIGVVDISGGELIVREGDERKVGAGRVTNEPDAVGIKVECRGLGPGGARVALWVVPNIEFFSLETRPGGLGSGNIPDIPVWAMGG